MIGGDEIVEKEKQEQESTRQTTCKRCGRKLKNPEAIQLGIGSTCWKKFVEENNHKKLW